MGRCCGQKLPSRAQSPAGGLMPPAGEGGAGRAEAGKELEVCGSGGLSPRSGRKDRIGGTKPGID